MHTDRHGQSKDLRVLDAHPGVALDEPTGFTDVLEPAFHKTPQHSSERLNLLRRLGLNSQEPIYRWCKRKNKGPASLMLIWAVQ